MKKKKVILIIDNSIDVTGALKSICQTACDLKDDYNFKFVIPSNSGAVKWIKRKGFNVVIEIPLREIKKRVLSVVLYLPFLLWNAFKLIRIIKKENVSIIHLNDLYNLLPVITYIFGFRIPYVSHIRFMPDRFPQWLFFFWLKLHLRYAYKVVAVSQSVAEMLPSHPKLVVIYDPLPLKQRDHKVETQNESRRFTFLYLSNFMIGKGQNFALEAFAGICRQIPEWRIRFVGGDMGLKKNEMFRANLMRKSKKLGIWEKTEWIGFTEDVESEYTKADIVLNFSESESFSMTCAEALYFGRPVIATDCGGPREIIENNKSGIIVKNRDISEMSSAMLLLATNKKFRDELSISGKRSVEMKFSSSHTSGRLLEIYNDISAI